MGRKLAVGTPGRPVSMLSGRPASACLCSGAAGLVSCIAARCRCCSNAGYICLPARWGGSWNIADGSSARVYQETVVDRDATQEPCVLVVAFRLRGVRGRGPHAMFRWESLLNTPLFVGFPGFVSKLWLANDDHGRYRGVYQWDGPRRADQYARALWRVLALVSVRSSIHYAVLPGFAGRAAQPAGDPGRWRPQKRRHGGRPTQVVWLRQAGVWWLGLAQAGLTLALQAHDHGTNIRSPRTSASRRPRPSHALILRAQDAGGRAPARGGAALLGKVVGQLQTCIWVTGYPGQPRRSSLPDTAFPRLDLDPADGC